MGPSSALRVVCLAARGCSARRKHDRADDASRCIVACSSPGTISSQEKGWRAEFPRRGGSDCTSGTRHAPASRSWRRTAPGLRRSRPDPRHRARSPPAGRPAQAMVDRTGVSDSQRSRHAAASTRARAVVSILSYDPSTLAGPVIDAAGSHSYDFDCLACNSLVFVFT